MPARAWKFRIEDILEAIDDISELIQGMSFDAFSSDNKTAKAVMYNLAVIGEAARRVPSEIALRHQEIPWREMGDMRNVIIHEYFGIDMEILWKTIQQKLPLLSPLLRDLLKKELD